MGILPAMLEVVSQLNIDILVVFIILFICSSLFSLFLVLCVKYSSQVSNDFKTQLCVGIVYRLVLE